MAESVSTNGGERPDDALVNLLSHWLARHVDDEELRQRVRAIDIGQLEPDQADAVDELLAHFDELRAGHPGELERLVRETLEAVALG
jgi:hypothetical protein